MKNLLVLFAVLVLAVACNQEAKQSENAEPTKEESTEIKSVTVDEVLASSEELSGSEVQITGMVTHVCKHGGQKLFIIGEDPEKQLRVDVGQEIPEFDMALEGSTVEFTGKVVVMSEELTEALAKENEEKEHHTGEEAHAKAESASYSLEASSFREVEIEVE